MMTPEAENFSMGHPAAITWNADPIEPPLVSIIVRSMARATLTEALDSIARQTYPHIEIILVNALGVGHPPPDKECGYFPLRFVDYGEALDRSAAANAGLDVADGRYLGFLDDDDLLFPDHVLVIMDALQQQTKAQVAYSGVQMVAYPADGAASFEAVYNQSFHRPSLRAQNYIPIQAVLFDRALLAAGCRFDESLTRYEDWDFWLQLAQHSEFLHVNQVTACYRNFGHSGFGLQADAEKIAADRAALFDKWRRLWSGAELSETLAIVGDGGIHSPSRSLVNTLSAELLADSITRLEQALAHLESLEQGRQAVFRKNQQQVEELSATVQSLHDQLAERSGQLAEICQSTSWRATQPVRILVHVWRQWRNSRE